MSATDRIEEDIEIDLLNGKVATKDKGLPQRDVWTRKSEYLLSLIGYTVGLSSVWRFPYLCMKNGGGAFLIPFAFFMVTCGFPLYYMELALGQFSGKSPLVLWNICPLVKGIGYTMVTVSLLVTWYSGAVIAWVLYYLGYSFSATLPWSTCDNEWNTDRCVEYRTIDHLSSFNRTHNRTLVYNNLTYSNTSIAVLSANQSGVQHTGVQTAATEFWRNKVLNVSSGIDDWGDIQWPIVLVLFLSYALSFICIVKGVRSVGKVVYVTAVMPYLLLAVILIRSLTLEGAMDGIIYYIKPDFSRLMHFQVWLEAALQVFYSLGPAWGGVLTMASFSRFHNKCLSDAVLCVSMDLFTAFYCGFVVFAIVGFLAHESGLKVDEVIEAGPGLVFLAYPEALTRLPLPQLWSVLFFIMVIFVGLDSQFGMLETLISGLTDMYPRTLGKRKLLILFVIFLFYVTTSLVFATQAGVYVFQLIDWYVATYCIFLTSFLECLVIGWLYGAERFSRDVELMTGMPVGLLIRWSWCIFVPVVMVVALGVAVTNMTTPVSSNGYIYPDYIGGIGILIGFISVIPIPIIMVVQILKTKGTLSERIRKLVTPASDWGPNDESERRDYKLYQYGDNICQNIKTNLLGDKK